MSLTSDIQSKLAHYALADVTLAFGAIVDQVSAAIDTDGSNALSLGLLFDRVFAGTDALTYKFQDSVDGTTGWVDIPFEGNLPFSAADALAGTLAVADVVVGQNQNVGCFSTRQFVRIVFNGTVDTTNFVISLPYVLELQIQENDRYLTNGLPGDGLP